MDLEVETCSVRGRVTALGSAGGHTLVIDRPASAGGGGLGFSGGELLLLAVAGCVSNDLFREALAAGISLEEVRVTARSTFAGDPAVSTGIRYEVEVKGGASEAELEALVARVDEIAEIPCTLRRGAAVQLGRASVRRSAP